MTYYRPTDDKMLPFAMPMDQIELKGQAESQGDLPRYEDITSRVGEGDNINFIV